MRAVAMTEYAMSILVHFCDQPDHILLVQYFIRDSTHGAFQVETITTSNPEVAIAQYQSTDPISIVVVEYPRDVAATIEQLRAHPNFGDAILLIITGRPQHYQALSSATVLIGDKIDQLRMLNAALAHCNAI